MSPSGVAGSSKLLLANGWKLSWTRQDAAASRVFPPVVASHIVKIACERPSTCGRSLSVWDCREIARELVETGVVSSISIETVRQVLQHHRLKPWRYQMWLSGKVTRNAAFACVVLEICDLYTTELTPEEVVVSVDEKTNLQPRTRKAPTLPTRPDQPTRVEHEYERKGSLNLIAGLDTRTGKVWGITRSRKRQVEFLEFLEETDRVYDAQIKVIHLVLDNVPMHHGRQVRRWLEKHPRFVLHYPPVHCSWMNQIEQWFSLLARKRLKIADFASQAELERALLRFIQEWNAYAHPFHWTYHSFEKILKKCDQVFTFDPSRADIDFLDTPDPPSSNRPTDDLLMAA